MLNPPGLSGEPILGYKRKQQQNKNNRLAIGFRLKPVGMRLLNKSKLKIQSKVLKTFQYPPLFGPMRFMMPFCWSNFKLYFTPSSDKESK